MTFTSLGSKTHWPEFMRLRPDSSWKSSTTLRNFSNWLGKGLKDMIEMGKGLISHDTLRDISDESLDDCIKNTQATQASLTKFYNSLINERVRRGLKLPDNRLDV